MLQMLGGVSKTRSTQLPLEDWVFKSADFWILVSNDNINTFLISCNYILSYFMDTFAFYYKKKTSIQLLHYIMCRNIYSRRVIQDQVELMRNQKEIGVMKNESFRKVNQS